MRHTGIHKQYTHSPSRILVLFSSIILSWIGTLSPDGWGETNMEPDMIPIPAGSFTAGSSEEERRSYFVPHQEVAAHRIELATFWIGRYEVSNNQFAEFLNDGGYRSSSYWSKEGWNFCQQYQWKEPRFWKDSRYRGKRNENMPVCAISWYEAEAYCIWLSQKTGKRYRLPSEWEWEKAARGNDGRIFPWGNAWNSQACNWYGFLGDSAKRQEYDPFIWVSPLGAFEEGKSPWGCYDMAGNVLEWCRDFFSEKDETYRVFRGGCFYSNQPRLLRCAWRGGTYPDVGHVYWGLLGFRVAMDEPNEEAK